MTISITGNALTSSISAMRRSHRPKTYYPSRVRSETLEYKQILLSEEQPGDCAERSQRGERCTASRHHALAMQQHDHANQQRRDG
ncbi:hypothetical protein [Azospirillum brasilense]|uniref:hypothetical protein n=1 Tax=Azospirillum brasilense TaxID=192 RepID=UPI001552DF1E|nr:hypothetical protein [Azospirillum brasilense]